MEENRAHVDTLCREPFEKMLGDIPHLRERMLEMALDELDAAREWMLLLGRKTAREKIASLLTIIARRQNAVQATELGINVSFDLSLTREAMSEYLGLTLETVSRQINALKKENVQCSNKSLSVPKTNSELGEKIHFCFQPTKKTK